MARIDNEILEKIGHITGTLEAMDKRLARMETKQDSHLKTTAKNSLICSGVLGVATSLIIASIKSSIGIGN